MNKYQIINGDSFEKLKQIPEEYVDHIITDPPYNISKDNNFHTMKGRQGIDFGEWDKGFDLTGWIGDAVKTVKQGGNIIIFNAWRNLVEITEELEKHGCEVKNMCRWIKNNPMPRNRDRLYITDYEYFIWAVKKPKGKNKWIFNRREDEPYVRPEYKTGLTPKSERFEHPTAKPVELLSQIVQRHTNEGDIILDPFSGVGSTGVASLKNNRNFIGIELDTNYVKIISERLKEQNDKNNK